MRLFNYIGSIADMFGVSLMEFGIFVLVGLVIALLITK